MTLGVVGLDALAESLLPPPHADNAVRNPMPESKTKRRSFFMMDSPDKKIGAAKGQSSILSTAAMHRRIPWLELSTPEGMHPVLVILRQEGHQPNSLMGCDAFPNS